MATMTATMKSFTKGLKAALEPMQTSLANIEQSLIVTASREDVVEGKRAEKVKLNEEKKQTSLLEKLFGKRDKDGKEGGSFLSKHWGKILTALAGLMLFLPKDFLKEKLFNVEWWKDTAKVFGIALVGYLALKTAWSASAGVFGGAIAGAVTSALLSGAGIPAALTTAFKMTGVLAVALALGKLALDGWEGYTSDWDASTFSKTLGGALGGKGKGALNSFVQGSKWAVLLGAGGFAAAGPIGLVAGMLLGAALGGIAGYIGGETISLGIDKVGKEIEKIWDNIWKDVFSSDKSTYKEKAQEFGQRIAKSSDKWLEEKLDGLVTSFDKIINWGKDLVNDIKEMFDKPELNISSTSHYAIHKKKMEDLKKNLDYLQKIKDKRKEEEQAEETKRILEKIHKLKKELKEEGKQHTEWNRGSLGSLKLQSYSGDGMGGGFGVTKASFGSNTDRNWIKNTDPALLLDYVKHGGSLQSWGIGKSNKINMTTGRDESWTHLSETSKSKTNILARFWEKMGFGKMQMTSGYRTVDENIEAMDNSKNSLNVYKWKWQNFLRKQFEDKPGLADKILTAGANTDLRRMGVRALMNNPAFLAASGHLHGNGIDIAYPPGKDKTNFDEVKAQIQDVFPGANVLPEKRHLHIKFDPAVSPGDITHNYNALQQKLNEGMINLRKSNSGTAPFINAPTTNNKTENHQTLVYSNNAQDLNYPPRYI